MALKCFQWRLSRVENVLLWEAKTLLLRVTFLILSVLWYFSTLNLLLEQDTLSLYPELMVLESDKGEHVAVAETLDSNNYPLTQSANQGLKVKKINARCINEMFVCDTARPEWQIHVIPCNIIWIKHLPRFSSTILLVLQCFLKVKKGLHVILQCVRKHCQKSEENTYPDGYNKLK